MTNKLWKAVLICFLGVFAICPVMAQLENAQLVGVVADSGGAVLPGAKISIRNVATGLNEATTSNSSGHYEFPLLPPGNYSIKVEASGFKTYVQNGIVLTVGQPATLNIAMALGATSTTVTVEGGVSQLNTTSASIDQTMNSTEVEDLPLNGREPSSLVFLAPGTTNEFFSQASTPVGEGFGTETSASSGGGRQGSVWTLLDGVTNMDTYGLESVPFPNSDATQEFRSIVNMYDARYGFAPSGVVIVETKSGTNDIHGGVFEYVRNNDVNASNWFSGAVDQLHRNQFGGFIGGPILRNKLFAFTNFQRTQNSYVGGTDSAYTPTAAMLKGDFSAVPVADLTGPLAASVFHTVNGVPNQADPTLFSKAAVAISALIPAGTDPATGFVSFTGPPQVQTYDENTSRLDYDINDRQRLFVRSFIYDYTQTGSLLSDNALAGTQPQSGTWLNLAVGHTWTLSPSLVNSLTLSWSELNKNQGLVTTNASGTVCMPKLINVQDPSSSACSLGGVSAFDGNSLYGGGLGFSLFGGSPEDTHRRYWWVTESVTKTIGKNTIVAGADLLHRFMYNNEDGQYWGGSFNGQYTGNPLADFLMGYLYSAGQGAGAIGATNGWMQGYYVQDQAQLRKNLTAEIGLRWEPFVPPSVQGGKAVSWVPGEQSTRYPNAPTGMVFPGDSGITNKLFATSYGYFMPRVGVTWQPQKQTSVRTGFGMFTQPMEDAFYRGMFSAAPFAPSYSLQGGATTPLDFQNPWSSFASTGGVSPFPPFTTAGSTPSSTATFLTPASLGSGVFSKNLKIAMTESWNFSIDRQFREDWAVHVGYVGSTTYHMAATVEQNPGNYLDNDNRDTYPNFNSILQVQDGATGKYDALELSVDKRFSHGLQFHSNYTWSKTMDVGGSGDPAFESSISDPYSIRHDYGLSSLNYPHIWTLNFVYDFPRLNGANGIVRNVVNGWVFSGLYTAQSGPPFTMNGGEGNNNSGFDVGQDRADVVPGQHFDVRKGGRRQWVSQYFNTAAFTNNAVGTPGDSMKFLIQEAPTEDADLAVLKNFKVVERYSIQLRAEAFNALNHPSFGQPGSNPGSSNYGQITNTGNIPPRVMQGALRVTF